MLSKTLSQLALIVAIIGINLSCNGDNQGNKTGDVVEPRFVITDSLVVDYLGELKIMDIKPDRSEFLMFDFQRKEMVRVDSKGQILLARNLTGDIKDGYGSSFISAHYHGYNEVLILTHQGFYSYDLSLNLIDSKDSPFAVFTNTAIGGHANLITDGALFTNIYPDNFSREMFEQEDFLSQFPFLTVYDLEQEKILARQYIPASCQMIKNKGEYRETAPFSIRDGDTIYLLFSYSPEIYQYSFPELELQDTIHLEPGDVYVQIDPASPKAEAFDRFFNELAASSYVGLYQSNGFLMTAYHGAAPREKVDALPKNVVGGPEFSALRKQYKIPYYQLIKDGKKLWEGHLDVDFRYKGGRLFAYRNMHLPKVEEESDHVVFYFYEIEHEGRDT
ncbi:MAG: hypothetical protein R6V72_04450 [Cyclobacterium sp.]|nr:hypothetical protein [Cyclobacterium sp. SYSU L10401]